MKQFVLDDAISCLDADLLATHLKLKEKYQRRKANYSRRIVKWSALVACVVLFVMVGTVLIPIINNPPLEGPHTYYYQGDVVNSKNGCLTLTSVDIEAKTVTFHLIKEKKCDSYVMFTGYSIVNEWIGEDGVTYQDVKHYDMISHYDGYKSDNGYEILEDLLIISVNAEIVNELPIDKGEYEIVIDFSRVSNHVDYIRPVVEVSGFGSFVIYSEYFE